MITLAILAATALAPQQSVPNDPRMQWWREARFGMFIHWGLYAIPAGKWGNNTGHGEWIRETARIPLEEYNKLQGQFNPTKFDANAWARMAKDAGMKYVVITSKHHDGFNLFRSKHSDWSIQNTPFKRDVMRELSTAVRKQGLQMGWYHSIMDWHHPDYLPRRSWESNRPAAGADMDRFTKYLHNEVRQLLTDYGPIGVMWFDGEWESTWTAERGKKLYDLCRSIQPNVIVNNRVAPGRGGMEDASLKAGDFGTPEQHIPATGIPGQDWETCMTMNDHWGYSAYNHNWKSSGTLIRNLVDIASKGGNYLLNVGPRADGTFPPEAVQRLSEIGKWMKRNGDSIYGTTASVFPKLSWGRSTTVRHGNCSVLYLHVYDWPKDGRLVVPGVENRVMYATTTIANSDHDFKFLPTERVGSDVVIKVPEQPLDPNVSVIKLEIRGEPVIYTAPTIEADSELLVGTGQARITTDKPNQQVRYTLDGTTPTATSSLYRGAIAVRGDRVLRAATFKGNRRVSPVVAKRFRVAVPSPAERVTGLEPGLWRESFSGTWSKLPDFGKLPLRTRELAQTIGAPVGEENIGLRYSGFLNVPADGVYKFDLTSDDGAQLWVDGKLVVDNDGLHAAQSAVGQTALAKGPHKVVVTYFNGTGGASLGLKWGRAGAGLKPMVAADTGHLP